MVSSPDVTYGVAWSEDEVIVRCSTPHCAFYLIFAQVFDLLSNDLRSKATIQVSGTLKNVSLLGRDILHLTYRVSYS